MDSGTKTWRNKLHKFRTQKRKLNGILCRTGGCCFLLFQRIFKHQMAVFETRPEIKGDVASLQEIVSEIILDILLAVTSADDEFIESIE